MKLYRALSVDMPGFTAVRADRNVKASGKSKGGGLNIYTNNRWCELAVFLLKW